MGNSIVVFDAAVCCNYNSSLIVH